MSATITSKKCLISFAALLILTLSLSCKRSNNFSGDDKKDSNTGESSTDAKKTDKPSNEGEGVRGYLVDPEMISINRTGPMVIVKAAGNWLAPTGTYRVSFWGLPNNPNLSQSNGVQNSILFKTFQVDSKLAFEESINTGDSKYLVVTLRTHNGNFMVYESTRSITLQSAFLDIDQGGKARAFTKASYDQVRGAQGSPPGTVRFVCVFSDHESAKIFNRPPVAGEACLQCNTQVLVQPGEAMHDFNDPRHPCEVSPPQ